ncbi:MAG: hypothetical protein HY343_09915 [Lentisphaerae bacterium]|nr:hypothetical protein [Lentisphaerota bacterium]
MFPHMPIRVLAAVFILGMAIPGPAWTQNARPAHLDALLAAYATAPQGYPSGKEYARPDTSVPFRWHFYHEGAIERFDHARMAAHVDSYNPLEDRGVRSDKSSGVKWQFVAEHATRGQRALRVDFPAEAIRAGQALVHVEAVAGGASFSEYLRARGLFATASCYGPHYRWIKLDAFNAASADVRLRVSGVPLVLRPGANVIAVKTADAVERHYQCLFNSIPIEATGPARGITLYLDNVRMEQETPALLGRAGKLFQFPGREGAQVAPVLAPGFTAVGVESLYTPQAGFGWTAARTTRQMHAHSFRSNEHGLLWGCCHGIDAPFRVDLPPGRYGLYVFGAPYHGHQWSKGLTVKINGRVHTLLAPRTDEEVRRMALSGEAWDFRPGSCVWEALVRPP